MKQIGFSGLILLVSAALLVSGSLSCSSKEEKTTSQTEGSEQPVENVIFTREDPGAYGGKEDSHIPRIVYEKTDTGLKITVSVEHEMNAEKPHFIEWIALWDEESTELGRTQFKAQDAKAEIVVELNSVPSKLTAMEKCNLHGIWREEIDIH